MPVPGSYHRTALFQQTTSSTKNAFAGCWWCSNAEDSASQRGHLRQYCTVVSQEVRDVHTFADLHIDVSESSLRCEMWRYSISLACIRIESTDGNFGTWKSSHSHSHCHMYPSHSHSHFWHICVPIPMGFPWESHGNPMGMGIPFPCTSLDGDDRVNGVSKSDRCGGRQGDRLDVIAEIT